MRAKKTTSVLLAALALLALSVPAFAQMKDMPMKQCGGPGHKMESGHMEQMGDMMGHCLQHAEKMGLSEDQISKMKPLHRDLQRKQARSQADLKVAEIDLMEIMDVKDFDLEKAGAAVRKISDIKTSQHLEMLKAMKEMRTILTEQQFKEMKKMMAMNGHEKGPGHKMMKKHRK